MQDDLLLRDTDNLIKRITTISQLELDKVTPSIWVAQITDIKRVLTESLYEKILTDFLANTLTGDYLTIYDKYVSNMLVFYAIADVISRNSIIIAQGGNVKHQSDNTVPADYKEVDRLVKYYRSLGASFELSFYEFIKDKSATIPEYTRTTTIDTETFKFGWQL